MHISYVQEKQNNIVSRMPICKRITAARTIYGPGQPRKMNTPAATTNNTAKGRSYNHAATIKDHQIGKTCISHLTEHSV